MKKQFLTLALLATVAVGGALAGPSVTTIPGAPFDASAPCSEPLKLCSDTVDELCTYEIRPTEFILLYGNTSPAPGTCTVQLYEISE